MSYSIQYHPQAEASLNSLDAAEQNRVRAAIHRLREFHLPDPNVHRLIGLTENDQAYALRAGNDLRVLFTATEDGITVLDVLNWHFAEKYG